MQQITKTYHKVQIYWWYFWEYLLFIDLKSIGNALRYVVSKKSNSTDRLVHSRMGLFICRKNTTDFMYANYNYERKVKKFIQKRINEYDTFLDVGACIGDYSIWLAKQGYKCLTFEPVPANFQVLQQNIALNDLTENIHSFQLGLGSQQEEVHFEVRNDNKGASRAIRNGETPGNSQNSAQILPLDSLTAKVPLNTTDRVLIKLDVEGMESEALKGAAHFIQNCAQLMIIIESSISDQASLKQLINQWGEFSYHQVDEHNFAAIKQPAQPYSVEYSQVEDLKRMNFIVNQVLVNTDSAAKVLDVGCGNGNMSIALGGKGCNVLGIDISPQSIEYAQQRNTLSNVSFKVVDASTLVASNQKYEAIVCSEVLEHLDEPQNLLHELRQVLTGNGVLVVTVPNGKGPRETLITRPVQWLYRNVPKMWVILTKIKALMGYKNVTTQSHAENLEHVQFFSFKALKALAKDRGFEIHVIKKANFIESVFPFSLLTKHWKYLQKLDSKAADKLPLRFTSGFYMVWKKV